MPNVECGLTTCIKNVKLEGSKYGMCSKEGTVTLKWRLAGDFGKGNIVMMECLNFELENEVA